MFLVTGVAWTRIAREEAAIRPNGLQGRSRVRVPLPLAAWSTHGQAPFLGSSDGCLVLNTVFRINVVPSDSLVRATLRVPQFVSPALRPAP